MIKYLVALITLALLGCSGTPAQHACSDDCYRQYTQHDKRDLCVKMCNR